MPRVPPELWVPIEVDSLESTAEEAVRSEKCTLVVAGPGAGKTELLAQRACFLLDTGTCAPPHRILAISFKRDAAKNLGDRVQERCGNQGRRFDSYTIDAFAKGLVDRFMPALPGEWRPKVGYELIAGGMKTDEMRDWLIVAGLPNGQSRIDLGGRSDSEIRRIFDGMVHGQVLPYAEEGVHALVRHWGLRWWREQLARPKGVPSLTFPMLNRLAALLLRCNPKLTAALRSTYQFVFLDEFQDTTTAQYDLIRAAFQGSIVVVTAVGDSKQRIMVWAGAMADIFNAFEREYDAQRLYLTRNYRSAPELVRMQHIIAQTLETGTPPAEASKVDAAGSCVLTEFCTPEGEAEYLATIIEKDIHEQGKKVRDFCIIVRQQTGEMIQTLKNALAGRGIRLRDESKLQDLLAEPAVKFLLAIIRLATRPRDAEAWEILTTEVGAIYGLDVNDDSAKINIEAKRLLLYARNKVNEEQPISGLPSELLAMVGESKFRSTYPQYRRGSYLRETIDALSAALKESEAQSTSLREVVDDIIGINVVPAMTIHKSKGLEFHTVIFLGLEDSQWWAFSAQADEEKRSFFVAFSRAIARVYFTFSDVRDGRWGRKPQRRSQIGDLYTILRQAGVPIINCR